MIVMICSSALCCQYVAMTMAQSTQQLRCSNGHHSMICSADDFTQAQASFLLFVGPLLPLVFACCMTTSQALNCQEYIHIKAQLV